MDPDCKVTSGILTCTGHEQDENFASCNVLAPVPGNKVTIQPTLFGSVTWQKIVAFPPTKRTAEPLPMDPRGIVLLWRFSKFLSTEFGAERIMHPRFTNGRVPNDCHDEGRAIDFSGAEGTFPDPFPRDSALAGRPYSWVVLTDWGNRPVPKGSGPPTASYRLAADKTLAFTPATPASAEEKRRAAASGVYKAETGTVTAGSDPNQPASSIGQTQRFAIGPDFGRSAQLRSEHQTHYHFQVGTTGHEPFPP